MCDVIPGVTQKFRGALGSLNRPFAIPGDNGEIIELTLDRDPADPDACDGSSAGFPALPADAVVTVVFTPPMGVSNVVALATDCGALAGDLAACQGQLGGGTATCVPANGGANPGALVIDSADRLRFRFPDTDALVGTPSDNHTLAGAATVAVSAVGDPLPCGLATTRCAGTSGLMACVDELYARDGTCENEVSHKDPTFGHFTALPPANDYQSLCTTMDPGAPCDPVPPASREIRFTTDAAGNALVPMDWRGVLVLNDQIPIPRLVLGDTGIEAFTGGGIGVDLPSDAFVASFSPGGHRLPPIFDPISNPGAVSQLSLFGSVDAPVGVIRVTRQGCVGGAKEGASCTTNPECGGGATCEELFDFSDRYTSGVGPVLIADAEFDLRTENPVPLDGLIESSSMFAFVANEAIDGELLNDDADTTDPVLRIRHRTTGAIQPIGTGGADGRAVTRVKQGRFRFPAVAVEDDVVAFLEHEPLEGATDGNGNGSVFDSILRVFRLVEDCGGGVPCADELTSTSTAADAAPLVEGESLAISQGLVYFRMSEWRQAPQVTERVSVDSGGTQGNGSSPINYSTLSSDGRIVAFDSLASNLVAGDSNNELDVFVHDRATGATERVSVASGGTQANAGSGVPYVSLDGDVVSFQSSATNLVPGDTNGAPDVFVRSRGSATTERVSVATGGGQGDDRSNYPTVSGDGQLVAFLSSATNLVAADTNFGDDIFVHDRGTGATERVSVAFDGSEMEFVFFLLLPAISSDGSAVVFPSEATNLVPGDTNGYDDIFVRDRSTAQTERVNVDVNGSQGNSYSGFFPSLSSDGRLAAFKSSASNLVPGDTNQEIDIFVHDRETGEMERVSVASDGSQSNGDSETGAAALSEDGRFVVFDSCASNLSADDMDAFCDAFIHDRLTGATERVGIRASAFGDFPSISADGRVVAFRSSATNLVPGDTNGVNDAFVRSPDESHLAADLSGDGDLQDTVLAVLDVATEGVTQLCPAADVALFDGDAVFLRPESSGAATGCPAGVAVGGGVDLNADADADDLVVHSFTAGQPVVNLARDATAVALSADLVGALVRGGSGDIDAQAYDRAATGWLTTGEAADDVAVMGTTLVFASPEAEYGADRNGDIDLLDRVLRVFELQGGALVAHSPLPAPAVEEFVLGERLVAFRTREASEGMDLNGDGDLADDVLQVYDLVSARFFNTEQAVTPCPLEACDPRFPYQVKGDTVTFITAESAQGGQDLNGDGDSTDFVKQVFNAREAEVFGPPSGQAGACVAAVAATTAGICTTTGLACASDTDCGGGTCYLPPGGCIEDLLTACVCDAFTGCSGCGVGEFCVPLVGSGGNGTCNVNNGPCATQTECDTLGGVCTNAATGVQRLLSPVSDTATGQGEVVSSSGTCVEDQLTPCTVLADCEAGDVCSPSGTCERRHGSCLTSADCSAGLLCAPNLVTVGAADVDVDGLSDPFDNCPTASNIEQADLDGDGIGDACDLMTCGNGATEFAEECDDGNASNADGCATTCETEETLSLYGTAEGGTVSLNVEGVDLTVPTTQGQSAGDVTAAIAAAINANPALSALGVIANAAGNLLWTTGQIGSTTVADPGLSLGIGVPVGPLAPIALVLALAVVARRELEAMQSPVRTSESPFRRGQHL